ncbi:hypothetical protein WA171_000661 [Blastocystis sp. BT1]
MYIESYLSYVLSSDNVEHISTMVETLDRLGYGGVVLVNEVDRRLLEEKDKADHNVHGIGLCKQQIAALVRDQGIGDSKEMRVFTRLSVVTEKKAQVYAINSEIGRTYDLVSVRPMNMETFEMACDTVSQQADCDCLVLY